METPRTLSLKSKAAITQRLDTIELSLKLSAEKKEYDDTMQLIAKKVGSLLSALEEAGFDKKDCKTAYFNIDTRYEYHRDKNKDQQRKFAGYVASQNMILRFDMDMEKLSQALSAVSRSAADPQINIRFTLKDKGAFTDRLLAEATKNALSRANLLAQAAGAKLGKLLRIDYNWFEIEFTSSTRLDDMQDLQTAESISYMSTFRDLEPEDITAEDSVSFVWELL